MKRFIIFGAAVVFFGVVLTLSPSFVQAEEPKQAVETYIQNIQAVPFPITDQAAHDQMVASANAALDLPALSKKALAENWDSAKPEDQKAFLDLMWKLVEYVAYPKSRRFMGKHKIDYPEVTPDSSGTAVHSVIHLEEKSLDAQVVYHLHDEAGVLKIDDILLDDVSITEDLKYQFDKIIQQSGFPGLLVKMQERLDRAKKDTSVPAAA